MTESPILFIVDDDEILLMVLRDRFTEQGYDVKTFTNGEECLLHLDLDPSVIILDLMLPGKTGIEILQMIKEKQKEVPVIILSAQDKIMTAVNSIKEGALDYFTKPLDTQRLDAAVRSASTIKRLSKKVADLEEQVDSRNWMIKVNSQNEKMKHVHHLMMKLRESDVTVLIQGES